MSVADMSVHPHVSNCHQYTGPMGRWEPDAAGRLRIAAIELYSEQGYDATTVEQIAERAGVTERTFFRYFSDKREVLFQGSQQLEHAIVANIAAARPDDDPFESVVAAMAAGASIFPDRDYTRRRAATIAANPSLQEREQLKMHLLTEATAAALRARGVDEPTAGLAARTGVALFSQAFLSWVTDDDDTPFPDRIRSGLAALRALLR